MPNAWGIYESFEKGKEIGKYLGGNRNKAEFGKESKEFGYGVKLRSSHWMMELHSTEKTRETSVTYSPKCCENTIGGKKNQNLRVLLASTLHHTFTNS